MAFYASRREFGPFYVSGKAQYMYMHKYMLAFLVLKLQSKFVWGPGGGLTICLKSPMGRKALDTTVNARQNSNKIVAQEKNIKLDFTEHVNDIFALFCKRKQL